MYVYNVKYEEKYTNKVVLKQEIRMAAENVDDCCARLRKPLIGKEVNGTKIKSVDVTDCALVCKFDEPS